MNKHDKLAAAPLTVLWDVYNADLDKMFGAASFDYLTKMGYRIWEMGQDGNYDEALKQIHADWDKLTPEYKAHLIMEAIHITEDGLASLLNQKLYNYMQ